MNKNLHDITEPSIPANIGWQQMHNLLNQHLPVKMVILNTKSPVAFTAAFIFLAMLLLTSLKLDYNMFFKPAFFPTPAPAATNTSGISLAADVNKRVKNITKLSGGFMLYKLKKIRVPFNNDQVLPVAQNETTDIATPKAPDNSNEVISDIDEKQTGKLNHSHAANTAGNATGSSVNAGSKKAIAKRSWNLLGGLGINSSTNNSQNLQPYPVAEARYNITPRFYIAAGISAWSPVSTNTCGVSKNLYLSDSLNNMSPYNEITTYHHLYYADIPLSVGVNISKNMSIQSGVQVSVLLYKKNKMALEPFDLSNRNISPSSAVLPFAAGAPKEYDVEVRNIDYRFIAGIRYALKKTTIGLTYQHALEPTGRGTYINTSSNHILALNVLYRIK